MSLRTLSALLCFTALAWPQALKHEFDAKADFSQYKKYVWVDSARGLKLDDPALLNELRHSFDAALYRRGFTKKFEEHEADVFVSIYFGLAQEPAPKPRYPPGTDWTAAPGDGKQAKPSSLDGLFVFDIYDAAKKTLIWRGQLQRPLDTGASPQKRLKNMDRDAEKLLTDYPAPKR